MAGNKAAASTPGWPLINGDWIPENMFSQSPMLVNFIGNKITIHFIHRNLAYLILIGITFWTVQLFRSGLFRTQPNFLLLPLILVFLQVILGILALTTSHGIVANRWVLFDWFALLHQFNAMLLLFSLIYVIYVIRPVIK
jgi:cytochrome c oxidase assembly protein subunit 15